MPLETLQVPPAAPSPAAGPKDAELAAKFEAGAKPPVDPAAAGEKPTKPEWMPEKFWDAEKGAVKTEELAKSYGELEKKASGKKTAEPAKAAEGEPAAADPDAAKAAVEAQGVDFDALDAEFQKDGKLSDESYEKLAKAGFDKARVDTYMAGVQAAGNALMSAAHTAAGGEQQFQEMQTWAATNASDADLKAYNELIATQDPAKIALAVQGLAAAHAKAEGTAPARRVDGSGNGADVGDVYESREQMKADMKTDAYKKDPAFRAKVQAKLGRSSIM